MKFVIGPVTSRGRDSSVGIAIGFGSADQFPVGARFFTQIQTGPGAHPTSCTMGTGSFPGVKRPGRNSSVGRVKGYDLDGLSSIRSEPE
jgi:hypothetical protein